MKPLISKKPGVEGDLGAVFDFIAQDKIEPAERFLEVAIESFERLGETPGLGQRWQSRNPRLAGIRMYPMPGRYRKYLIFYLPLVNGVDILCVLHGARHLERVLGERI